MSEFNRKLNRTSCRMNTKTGLLEYFFDAREGIYGPFFSEEQTAQALEEFVKFNIEFNDDGGRSLRSKRFNYGR